MNWCWVNPRTDLQTLPQWQGKRGRGPVAIEADDEVQVGRDVAEDPGDAAWM